MLTEEKFKQIFLGYLNEDPSISYENSREFDNLFNQENEQAVEMIEILLTTIMNLITREGRNKSKTKCLDLLNMLVEKKIQAYWNLLHESELWNILIEISNFRKHKQDPNKGRHIFLDTNPEDQVLALEFYQTLRAFLLGWARKHPENFDGSESRFITAYFKVFGGDPRYPLHPRNQEAGERVQRLRQDQVGLANSTAQFEKEKDTRKKVEMFNSRFTSQYVENKGSKEDERVAQQVKIVQLYLQ